MENALEKIFIVTTATAGMTFIMIGCFMAPSWVQFTALGMVIWKLAGTLAKDMKREREKKAVQAKTPSD